MVTPAPAEIQPACSCGNGTLSTPASSCTPNAGLGSDQFVRSHADPVERRRIAEGNNELFVFRRENGAWKIHRYLFSTNNRVTIEIEAQAVELEQAEPQTAAAVVR